MVVGCGLFIAALAAWRFGMLPELGGAVAVAVVAGRFLWKPRRPLPATWVDPDAEAPWQPQATVTASWASDLPRDPRPALGAGTSGMPMMTRAQLAFAMAIEQAELYGRALGIQEEQIHADIARALRESAASTGDALSALTRQWTYGVGK